MKLLTLAEAAHLLRMSRSSLYQRKDIPRYRRPGSRVMLFDQDELETWLKQGRVDDFGESPPESPAIPEIGASVVDISTQHIYHRNSRYRQGV